MYWVYIIYSSTIDKFYTGQTDDMERRLEEHNRGKTSFSAGECHGRKLISATPARNPRNRFLHPAACSQNLQKKKQFHYIVVVINKCINFINKSEKYSGMIQAEGFLITRFVH